MFQRSMVQVFLERGLVVATDNVHDSPTRSNVTSKRGRSLCNDVQTMLLYLISYIESNVIEITGSTTTLPIIHDSCQKELMYIASYGHEYPEYVKVAAKMPHTSIEEQCEERDTVCDMFRDDNEWSISYCYTDFPGSQQGKSYYKERIRKFFASCKKEGGMSVCHNLTITWLLFCSCYILHWKQSRRHGKLVLQGRHHHVSRNV